MNAEDNVYAKSDWTFYLSDEEYKEFSGELKQYLKYIDKVKKVQSAISFKSKIADCLSLVKIFF